MITARASRSALLVLGLAAAFTLSSSKGGPAAADTLYQAAPPPAAPGHPLRLGADHKAQHPAELEFFTRDGEVASELTRELTITVSDDPSTNNIVFLSELTR